MSTLVTGAAGFLGSHVTRQLVARGDDVRVLLRASSTNRAIADLPLEYVTGDLRDPASLDRAMKGVKRVFHVAADYRLWAKRKQDIYDSNVGGTKNLLFAAIRAGVEQFIYTSTVATIAVDRPQHPNEFTDTRLEEMVGHYKRSKWMAEQEALKAAKAGLAVIAVMPTTPGGPLLAAEKGRVGERYLLGGENLTLKQLLDTLSRITGLSAPKLKIPHGLALGVAYANTLFSRLIGREPGIPVEGVKIARHMMFVDCSRAQRELGFKAGPVAGALERAVRWYEANGYINKGRARKMALARAA